MEGDQSSVVRRIRESLQRVEERAIRLRRRDTWLMVSGVVTSSVATLITGVTAAIGPVVGEGISGWRLACAVGATFAFLSAVTVGLDRRLQTSDRLAAAHQALGRLRFLDIAADTGSRTREEITKEYEEIFKAYPEIVA